MKLLEVDNDGRVHGFDDSMLDGLIEIRWSRGKFGARKFVVVGYDKIWSVKEFTKSCNSPWAYKIWDAHPAKKVLRMEGGFSKANRRIESLVCELVNEMTQGVHKHYIECSSAVKRAS